MIHTAIVPMPGNFGKKSVVVKTARGIPIFSPSIDKMDAPVSNCRDEKHKHGPLDSGWILFASLAVENFEGCKSLSNWLVFMLFMCSLFMCSCFSADLSTSFGLRVTLIKIPKWISIYKLKRIIEEIFEIFSNLKMWSSVDKYKMFGNSYLLGGFSSVLTCSIGGS